MKKFLVAMTLLCCGSLYGEPQVLMQQITADELFVEIQENVDLWVLNVLGRRLHSDCHIPTSINVPLRVLHKELKRWDKNQPIVVYCALDECDASELAYEMLVEAGFSDVRAYEGGIREWYRRGLPVDGPCAFEYLKSCDCLGKDKIDPQEFIELKDEC